MLETPQLCSFKCTGVETDFLVKEQLLVVNEWQQSLSNPNFFLCKPNGPG